MSTIYIGEGAEEVCVCKCSVINTLTRTKIIHTIINKVEL